MEIPAIGTQVQINGVNYPVENLARGFWVYQKDPTNQNLLVFINGNWQVYYPTELTVDFVHLNRTEKIKKLPLTVQAFRINGEPFKISEEFIGYIVYNDVVIWENQVLRPDLRWTVTIDKVLPKHESLLAPEHEIALVPEHEIALAPYQIPNQVIITDKAKIDKISKAILCQPTPLPEEFKMLWSLVMCGGSKDEFNRYVFADSNLKISWYRWNNQGYIDKTPIYGPISQYLEEKRQRRVANFSDKIQNMLGALGGFITNKEEAKEAILSGNVFNKLKEDVSALLMKKGELYALIQLGKISDW